MKYIVCQEPKKLLLQEKEAPKRKENEALLQINKVGICGTDFSAYLNKQAFFTYPRILGHELASKVLEIDKNSRGIKTGDRVVIIPYISCGKCIACRKGKTNCCTNISVIGVHEDGGMQEQITVPVDILLPANNLSYEQIVIVEPLAIGAHAVRRASIIPDEFVAVVGSGSIGIGIMKFAKMAGAKVIAIDTNERRLDYAKEEIGVDFTIKGKTPFEQIKEITNGDLCDVVFDASGSRYALEIEPSYMSNGGRFVLVGLSKGELIYNHPQIHSKEITLMCSRNATLEDFEYVISVLDQFPTESFITHKVPFTKMIENFDGWLKSSNLIKAVVDFKNAK